MKNTDIENINKKICVEFHNSSNKITSFKN